MNCEAVKADIERGVMRDMIEQQRQQEARRHDLQATVSDMPGIEADAQRKPVRERIGGFWSDKLACWGPKDPGRGLLTVAGGDHRLGRFGAPLGEV